MRFYGSSLNSSSDKNNLKDKDVLFLIGICNLLKQNIEKQIEIDRKQGKTTHEFEQIEFRNSDVNNHDTDERNLVLNLAFFLEENENVLNITFDIA